VIEASVHEAFEFDAAIAQIQIGVWPPDFPGDWEPQLLVCPIIGSVIMKHQVRTQQFLTPALMVINRTSIPTTSMDARMHVMHSTAVLVSSTVMDAPVGIAVAQ